MKARKIFALLLTVITVFGLCACGVKKETAGQKIDQITYTVKVVDEKGDPVSGATVQLCSTSCLLGQTDDTGVAAFQTVEDDYKVSFVVLPAGYTAEETEYHFDAGKRDLTITLKGGAA